MTEWRVEITMLNDECPYLSEYKKRDICRANDDGPCQESTCPYKEEAK